MGRQSDTNVTANDVNCTMNSLVMPSCCAVTSISVIKTPVHSYDNIATRYRLVTSCVLVLAERTGYWHIACNTAGFHNGRRDDTFVRSTGRHLYYGWSLQGNRPARGRSRFRSARTAGSPRAAALRKGKRFNDQG